MGVSARTKANQVIATLRQVTSGLRDNPEDADMADGNGGGFVLTAFPTQ